MSNSNHKWQFPTLSALILALLIVPIAHSQYTIDFETGGLDGWDVVDESPENLNEKGPSVWDVHDSEFGLDGRALSQASNIWGSPGDTMLMGTFAVYVLERYANFRYEVDVSAGDNDGMGLFWAFDGTGRHYRVMMINDRWPDPPLDGNQGPMLIAHKRISDAEPWYEVLTVVKDDYIPYPERQPMHWALEVVNGSFTFTRDDDGDGTPEASISGFDDSYTDGFVGIQLYAQQAEFDNIVITPLSETAVDPRDKLASMWATIKKMR